MSEESDKITEKPFQSLHKGYQEVLEKKMEGSGFVFDYVGRLSCSFHKTSLHCGRSYIDSLSWIKT